MSHTISTWWDEDGNICISMDAATAHALCDKLGYGSRSTELGVLMTMLSDRLVRPQRRKDDAAQTPESEPPAA